MRIQLTDTRAESVRQFEYHDAAVSIGSDSGNLLQLPSMEVPAYLAMLMPSRQAGTEVWTYVPVDPAGVAILDEFRIDGPHVIEEGDEIRVDRFVLRFEMDADVEIELPEAGNVDELAKIRQYPLPPRSETQRPENFIHVPLHRFQPLAAFLMKLSSLTDYVRLLEVTLEAVQTALGARRVWMGIRRTNSGRLEFVDGRTSQGRHAGDPPMLETFTYRCLSRRQYIRIPRPTDKSLRSQMAIPITGEHGPVGLIYADTARGEHRLDAVDMDILTVAAAGVALQIEAIAGGVQAHQHKIEEGKAAFIREVQSRLDLTNVPVWPQLQIAAYAKPGAERAGDIYDITRLPNGLASIMLGHVTADATRAAMAMTEIRSAFRIASLHADPPHIQLKALNWLLHDDRMPCRFDGIIMMINPKTGAIEYAIAGYVGAVVIAGSGEGRPMDAARNVPVGPEKGSTYERQSLRLADGASLVLFSPGCARACNREGEVLGRERLVEVLCDGFGLTAARALDGVLSDLQGFIKTGVAPDDITILYMHRVTAS
ncbi:MAG: hypothetical protein C4547_00870 [Phycisphaerales bacterium]|nr:MAG: hypothetical protein C4547_00870 [Phycisphaerales bacterium]